MRARIKPSKVSSAVGMMGLLAFFLFGLYVALPSTGWFGVLWTFGALAGAVFHGVNLFSDHGIAQEVVEFDDNSSEADVPLMSPKTTEQRLGDLEALQRRGRISTQEYEEQRQRILNDI